MPTLPFEERALDGQYVELLERIVNRGEWVETRHGPRALTLMQQTMVFHMADGFPMITERDMSGFWRKPIGELCAFINGATTVTELEEFGCDWWGPWATPEKTEKLGLADGDLGLGSYGGAFHDFPSERVQEGSGRLERTTFDQFEHLVQQIRELPNLRTHFVSPWIPLWQARGGGRKPLATIAPCHGWLHVRVLNGRLHLHMFQRSGDVPVGVPSNMIQYAALLLMLEQLTGYEAGVYYHTISDAHIYEDQLPAAQELIDRKPGRFPTVTLTEAGRSVTDIHDFRAEHFELADYHPQPAMRIPVAV